MKKNLLAFFALLCSFMVAQAGKVTFSTPRTGHPASQLRFHAYGWEGSLHPQGWSHPPRHT